MITDFFYSLHDSIMTADNATDEWALTSINADNFLPCVQPRGAPLMWQVLHSMCSCARTDVQIRTIMEYRQTGAFTS